MNLSKTVKTATLTWPELPEGYYWSYEETNGIFGFGVVNLKRKRKHWFDQTVSSRVLLYVYSYTNDNQYEGTYEPGTLLRFWAEDIIFEVWNDLENYPSQEVDVLPLNRCLGTEKLMDKVYVENLGVHQGGDVIHQFVR